MAKGFSNDLIMCDTDSGYFTISGIVKEMAETEEDQLEVAVLLANDMAKKINASFPQFMADNFLVSLENGGIIQAKRESVCRRGLFKNAKKRYALHIVDDENRRVDEIKTIGMETKRTDTPKYIQKFLERCLEIVVKEGKGELEVREAIDIFRTTFRAMPDYAKGTPCGISNLSNAKLREDDFNEMVADWVGMKKKSNHFSVSAGLNTNRLMDIHQEHRWDYIRDGDKIEILYLKKNDYGIDKVALPVGVVYIPDWFKALPFDNKRHEYKLIDKKLENTLGILGWDLSENDNFLDELFGDTPVGTRIDPSWDEEDDE